MNNITAEPIQPVDPPEHSLLDLLQLIYKKFRWYIFGLIGCTVLVLAAYYGFNAYKANQAAAIVSLDRQITESVFALRIEAKNYYDKHFNYQNWEPSPTEEAKIKQTGSNLIVFHPDFQSYLFYAQFMSSTNYFCADSTGFVGEVSTIPADKVKCN